MKSQLVRSDARDYTVSAINCKIVRQFYVTLLLILHFNGGKFIRLTVFRSPLPGAFISHTKTVKKNFFWPYVHSCHMCCTLESTLSGKELFSEQAFQRKYVSPHPKTFSRKLSAIVVKGSLEQK